FENVFEGFQKIDDGVYEVVIDHASEDATKTGAESTNFQMTIRNDLDQPFKNQKIWERVFKAKATGTYNMMMFNTIGKAAGLQSGKTYNSFEELLEDFRGKDRKSTRLNSSHASISYAVFCLKKKRCARS